ncbi:hypothetical protein TNCV_4456711 [Trichonephila clavipes]|nr:hypothetical protein TNCV_4456711 [Trichonephila clavipes]
MDCSDCNLLAIKIATPRRRHAADTKFKRQKEGAVICNIAVRVCRDPMTVSRTWNRWVQDDNTEGHAGSQRPPIPSSREDRHVTRMALMDSAAMS